MKKEHINQLFQIFFNENPLPKTELNYINNYTLLVAIVLSAQATDISVNKATDSLFKIAKSPEEMLQIGELKLKEYIKTIGLYNSKAKNIILLSEMLIKKHNSQVPSNLEDLEHLPGVGRKTANVLLNCAFGHDTIAVDTHVFRVSNRLGLTKAKTPLESEKILLRKIPTKWKRNAHNWLVLHGRYICKASSPKCQLCKIAHLCKSNNKKGGL